MQIILCDKTWELTQAWEHAFQGTKVEVRCEDILKVEADAIVSPANSFGYMDGGLDLVYSLHFGWELEEALRERLLKEWHGEMPVGNAIIVPIANASHRWLVSAPTMRVPSRVENTTNAYLAFRAVLRAVTQHNRGSEAQIESIVCPGLGTGEGGMPHDRCARQMRRAFDVVVKGDLVLKGGLAGAVEDHMALVR